VESQEGEAVKLTHLIAIICFVLSVCFYAWHVSHGSWTWTLWMLCGLTFWCVSGAHDRVP
jgi:hypothetical protein